jgi:hypothetical protein
MWGAKRGTGSCDLRDHLLSESYVRHHGDLPVGLSDVFFSRLNTQHIYSPDKGAGAVSAKCFWRRRVRTDQRWDAGVGAGGGQPGSIARARRSLATDQPYEIRVSHGGNTAIRLEVVQDQGRSQPEERHGMAVEVLRIISRWKNPLRGFFG